MTNTYKVSGMTCGGCVATVKGLLESQSTITNADISLENGTATISSEEPLPINNLKQILSGHPKYSIEEIQGKTIDPTIASVDKKTWFQTYKPLLLIFVFIAGVSALASTDSGSFDWMTWMRYFMAGFFIVFSFFKFLDLKGFAESYAMYDLLAIRIPAYGYVYPFIELLLGIAFLVAFNPQVTYIATILIMGFSSIGVILSVLNKQKIRCACLGMVFNLPMSTVTIVEDLLMVLMAFFMLVRYYV